MQGGNPDQKRLLLGCCMTGAKYTPLNHRLTQDRIVDAISSGDFVPTSPEEIALEAELLFDEGCRYIHIHARNPVTREQSCDRNLYSRYGRDLAARCDDLLLSYGASRNGVEILDQIGSGAEWDRIAHSTLSRAAGGADFVTLQAAAELQVACDLERQGYVSFDHDRGRFQVLKPLEHYQPSERKRKVRLSGGSDPVAKDADYGVSSAALQHALLRDVIDKRIALGLPLEVEWVQNARSHFLTWYVLNHMIGVQPRNARLNVTILFGFSPRLPIPLSYETFLQTVRNAQRVARALPDKRHMNVTVTVGAAVLPRHATAFRQAMDVGPLQGEVLSPLDRILAYACQPDSGVDLVRVGLEDTPFLLDRSGTVIPTTNLQLVQHAKRVISDCGATVTTDRAAIHRFAGEDRIFAETGQFLHAYTRKAISHTPNGAENHA